MSATQCPDLEVLFLGLDERRPEALAHVESCPACAAVVEEHRALEGDLLRMSDPLPPPDFVQKVMAKVDESPAPVRREVWTGIAIFASALAAGAFVLVDSGAAGVLGPQFAHALLWMRSFLLAAPDTLRAVWSTSSLPITFGAALLLAFVLFGLRKLAGEQVEVQVSA